MFNPTLTDSDNEATETDDEDCGGHPLFPRPHTETGPDRRRFDLIQLVRYLPDGTKEVCPKPYKGSELRSWQQVLDDYGGDCTYQLIAQDKSHKYSAWSEKAYFATPARKAFDGGPWKPKQQESNAVATQQGVSISDVLLQMNLGMMKLLAERRDYPPPPPQANPIEMLREAAALLNGANRTPNPLEMVKEILPLVNSGDNAMKTLMQGFELARKFSQSDDVETAAPARNTDELGDIVNIAKIIGAVFQSKAAAPAPAQTPAPQPQPQLPPQPPAFNPPYPAPPGHRWALTDQGWMTFPVAMPQAAPPAPTPPPQPPPPAAPQNAPASAPPHPNEDAILRALIAEPRFREKLNAMLASENTPLPAPAPSMPAPQPNNTETSQSTNSTNPVAPPDEDPPAQDAEVTIDASTIPLEIASLISNLGAEGDFLSTVMKTVPPEHSKLFGDIFTQCKARLEAEDA